jgi:hypothetical protein
MQCGSAELKPIVSEGRGGTGGKEEDELRDEGGRRAPGLISLG